MNARTFRILLVLLLLCVVCNSAWSNSCEKFSSDINFYVDSRIDDNYLPQGRAHNLDHAYLIQKCIVNDLASGITGFKAGLVEQNVQQRFYAKEPMMGVLLKQHINKHRQITINQHKTILFEAELAFRLKSDISSLKDIELPFNQLVDSVAPVIELADFSFKIKEHVNANDLIAANAGANAIYVGKYKSVDEVNLKQLMITVANSSDNSTNIYKLSDNYQDDIRWLLRKVYLEGYDIKENMILLPGSISKPIVLNLGTYCINYQGLGYECLSINR